MWWDFEIECLQNTFSKLSPVNIYTNIIMKRKRSMHNIEIIQRTRQPNSCGSPRPPTCFLLLLMGEELQFHGTTTSMVDSPCLKSLCRETHATWSGLCLGPLWKLIKIIYSPLDTWRTLVLTNISIPELELIITPFTRYAMFK